LHLTHIGTITEATSRITLVMIETAFAKQPIKILTTGRREDHIKILAMIFMNRMEKVGVFILLSAQFDVGWFEGRKDEFRVDYAGNSDELLKVSDQLIIITFYSHGDKLH